MTAKENVQNVLCSWLMRMGESVVHRVAPCMISSEGLSLRKGEEGLNSMGSGSAGDHQ